MRLRTVLAGAVAALAVATTGLVGAGAAGAQTSGNTTVTFRINAGGLTIAVPASANLGEVFTGAATISGQLGSVTVTDRRGNLVGLWTATVTSTDFVAGADQSQVIDNADVIYTTGVPAVTGVGLAAPGTPGNLDATHTAVIFTGGVGGVTSATWNPSLLIAVGDGRPAGLYTATVTHSVA